MTPVLIALLALALLVAEWRSGRRLHLLGEPPGGAARLLPDLALVIALALLFAAERSPSRRPPPSAPLSLALAVDVSTSMGASDLAPSRIGRAREEIRALVAALPGARFALLPFAGAAVDQVPLTDDHEALLFFVDRLAAGSVSAPGSAPSEAVAAAAALLEDVPGEKAIMLFSDGERTVTGHPPVGPSDIPVYAVPLGTPAGAPVPAPRTGEPGTPRNRVLTRLDEENLRRLTENSGGRLLPLSGEATARALAARWQSPAEEGAGPFAPAFLSAAIGLLLLRQLPGREIPWRRKGAGAALLCLLLFGACRTETKPEGRELFETALAKAKEGSMTAADLFARAAGTLEGKRRAAALYNRGTLLLGAGAPGEAIPPLEEALLLHPGDPDIRTNLALALRACDRTPPPGLSGGDPVGGEGNRTGQDGFRREQALQLATQIRPEPLAPRAPSAAEVREPVPGRTW